MSNEQQNSNQRKRNRRLYVAGLFWAAAVLAVINIGLVIWFAVSPNLAAGSHVNAIEKVRAASEAWKPSPFTPVVDENPQPARNRVAKVRPMAVSTIDSIDDDAPSSEPPSVAKPPIGADVLHTVYQHDRSDPADQPRRIADDQHNGVVRGAQMYDLLETQTDMPRVTASNYNARHSGGNGQATQPSSATMTR